jgi:alpha-L-fucosidase
MGRTNPIAGFTYLPRQDGLLNGVVEKYRFETSADGVNWTTNIASGSFANIQNNPSLQEVSFAPLSARYFGSPPCRRPAAVGRARRKSPPCPPAEGRLAETT